MSTTKVLHPVLNWQCPVRLQLILPKDEVKAAKEQLAAFGLTDVQVDPNKHAPATAHMAIECKNVREIFLAYAAVDADALNKAGIKVNPASVKILKHL